MKKLLFIFAILILANCYSSRYAKQHPELNKYQKLDKSQKRQYLEIEKDYDESDVNNIVNGLITVNMTNEQVRLSWGSPDNIQDTDSLKQWVYVRRVPYRKSFIPFPSQDDNNYNYIYLGDQYKIKKQYLYFEDGILISWVN